MHLTQFLKITEAAVSTEERIIAHVKQLAAQYNIDMELSAEAGFIPGITVTDMYAETPGAGGGTKVMSELISLADQHEIMLFVWPEGGRSRKFYEKFGFVMTEMPPQMIRVPNFDPAELEELQRLNEAIPLAPRDYMAFTKKRIEDIDYVQSQLQEIHDKIKGSKPDEEAFEDTIQSMDSAMRDVDDELNTDDLLGWGEKVYGDEEFRAARALNLDGLKGNLELSLLRTQEDDPDMRILASALDRYVNYAGNMEWVDRLDGLIEKKEQIHAGMEDRGLFDEDYPKHAKMAKTLLSIIDNLSNIQTALKRIVSSAERYQVILNKRAAFFRGEHQFQPETEEIETLWHATAYAAEIAQSGFEAEGRGERRGVGTYGDFHGISFTHDLKIAHDISRSLKELTLIANGQVTRRHILGWMQKEGIDPQKAASVYGQEVLTSDEPKHVGNLYRVYLAYSPLRTDPVFANISDVIAQLGGRKPQDVGVIQAEVNMRTPGIKHQTAEAEWIVPTEAVKSYKRLY